MEVSTSAFPSAASEPLLTVTDVARMLNVPVSWVYAKTETGAIKHFKVGRYLRFRATDIESYLVSQSRGAEA